MTEKQQAVKDTVLSKYSYYKAFCIQQRSFLMPKD